MKDVNKLLLHIKALVWCLHRLCQRYNYEYVVSSLKEGKLHPDIINTKLGENLKYVIENIDKKDISKLILCLNEVPKQQTDTSKINEHDDEIGYYIKSTEEIEDLPANTSGVIIKKNNDFEGLFYTVKEGLIKKDIKKSQMQIVSATFP